MVFKLGMANNKERIEILEANLGGLQESVNRMEMGFNEKMHQLEKMINQLAKTVCVNKKGFRYNNGH